MDGFKAYRYYLATKLHFTTDKFNVFVNPNVKGSRDAFLARNDRFLFEKLAKKFPKDFDIVQYFVSNFAYGNDAVVYSGAEAESNYAVWQKRKQSITRILENDLFAVLLHVEKERIPRKEIFTFSEDKFPELLKLHLGNHITVEGVVILNEFFQFIPNWKDNANLIWEEECRRIEKCKGFVKYDVDKIKPLIENFIGELKELKHGTHIS
jgi:hypothetical protein